MRILAATHRDLKAEVAKGSFREDLFYRLNTMVLRVPPLRERQREILLLAEQFALAATRDAGREPIAIGTEVAAVLEAHPWPGNVRELRNVIHSAVMMCDGPELQRSHLPADLRDCDAPPVARVATSRSSETGEHTALPLEEELRTLETQRIIEALTACDGNQTHAAKHLGIPRRTLVYKIRTLGIKAGRRK